MKLIFLDFDGVLNSMESLTRMPFDYKFTDERVDPEHVRLLNELIDATGAQVVVSSMWRLHFKDARLQEILEEAGFKSKIIGSTPRGSFGSSRGSEIQTWLNTLSTSVAESVESWVALDDNPIGKHWEARLVRTDFDTGLTESEVQRAIVVLNTPIEAAA